MVIVQHYPHRTCQSVGRELRACPFGLAGFCFRLISLIRVAFSITATFQGFGLIVEAFGKTEKPPPIFSQQYLLIFALLGDCTTTRYGG